MRGTTILLTGGAGDLGGSLAPLLVSSGAVVSSLDPKNADMPGVQELCGSILDEKALHSAVSGTNLVIHIAAWHGYHEFTRSRSVEEFWDLNMTGTFKVLESCVQHGVSKLFFISSTSVDEWPGIYGTTKFLGEELCRAYAARHQMQILALRPRAFIPWWNKSVYPTFTDWARWFARGAVHINDVRDGVIKGCELLLQKTGAFFDCCELDGKHTFSPAELTRWQEIGGVAFLAEKFPHAVALMRGKDFVPAGPPTYKDLTKAQTLLGYAPQYGFKELLKDLETRDSH